MIPEQEKDRRVESSTKAIASMIMHALPSDMGFVLIVFDASGHECLHLATSLANARSVLEHMRAVLIDIEARMEPPS